LTSEGKLVILLGRLFSKTKYFAGTKNNKFFLQGLKPKRSIFAGTKTIF